MSDDTLHIRFTHSEVTFKHVQNNGSSVDWHKSDGTPPPENPNPHAKPSELFVTLTNDDYEPETPDK